MNSRVKKDDIIEALPESDVLDGFSHPRVTLPLVGHKQQATQVVNAFDSGHFPHAWLLTGVQGIGKATFAYHMARFLFRGGRGGLEGFYSIEKDQIYAQMQSLGLGNLKVIRREWSEDRKKFTGDIVIDNVRAMKSLFQHTGHAGDYRIAIIDSVDDLNISAGNALLKMLEEPPAGGILILICHQLKNVLPTIRSRCRVLSFSGLSESDGRLILERQGQTHIPWSGDSSTGGSVRLSVMLGEPVWQDLEKSLTLILKNQKPFRYEDIPHEKILGLLGARGGYDSARFLEALTVILDRVLQKTLTQFRTNSQNVLYCTLLIELWEKLMTLCRESIELQIEPNGVLFSCLYLFHDTMTAYKRLM